MSERHRPSLPQPHPEGVDESVWMDVIHKMDEVYTQLVADEVALEAKNAELEQTQQFLMSLLSSMSDVLLACDRQGRIVETNAALCELVGRSDEALRGTPLATLLADDDSRDRLRHVLDALLPERALATVEVDLVDAQGQRVPVDLNCTPRRDGDGRRAGHVLVGRPMGELKRAYHALREAHEALKLTQQQLLHSEKLASLGRLVAGVAHELNNPISFVLGNVHALQRYSERLRRYLDAVHAGELTPEQVQLRRQLRIDALLADLPSLMEGTLEGAQRTADIVQGLRRFSAVDREQRERVDLNGVIERAIHWVCKGTAPSFTVHWTPGPPLHVQGSAGQLLQVLMNLIQNAYDAAAETTPQPTLWITLAAQLKTLTLTLRDNGPGIAAEHLGRVFDPFFTTKPVGTGTGLGLSISYGIVEQHGGRLSAGNDPRGGALLTLVLPRAD
ncbi:MAG: PAS domain-containing protein [Burkholderiaceae bacterium]|nr:PAS domain-containing protein [Burkholderiaceae bacterium]